MHYLGFEGLPRRYYAYGDTAFMSDSAQALNAFISVAACIVAVAQILFIWNLIVSLRNGKPAGPNPWEATSLEWQTPDTPPKHGNFGENLPLVYRWAYDYSVPGAVDDYIPQNVPPEDVPTARTDDPTASASEEAQPA
jgi:cytochrome c oxidase subunit 1